MRVRGGLFVLLMLTAGTVRADTLRVAAAANLQSVLTKALIPAFEKKTGAQVTATFGATKLLAAQLRNGLPADVFVAADTDTVDKLVASGILDARTKRVYAIGQLVLWTRRDAKNHPKRLQELANPTYPKIALANPALAPYGRAAQESLANAGLTRSVGPRLVQAENIAQAWQYAKSGNADVALTALSLVVGDTSGVFVVVPEKLHAPISQSGAVVKASSRPALARCFLAFLVSKDAAPSWRKFGYELPPRK